MCAVTTDHARWASPESINNAPAYGRHSRQGFTVDSETPSTSTGHAEQALNALLARKNDLFGPPPLIHGDDATVYEKLLAGFTDSVKPADILEEMWVREAVDLHWEVLRLRRLKTQLLQGRAYRALRGS